MAYSYSNEELLRMYYHLVKGRIYTLKMHQAVQQGNIRSSFHTPYGEEALGVGITSALKDTDWLSPNHRFQTGCLMRMDDYKMTCEIFGKKDGYQQGTAFDFHWSEYENLRMLMPVGTLGSKEAMSVGFAWQVKRRGEKDVVVNVSGEGGCHEGVVYETWNIAAMKKVPLVHVIDNNGWAMTVPIERETLNPTISDKARAFGLSVQVVDGNDILAVRNAMEIAREKALNFEPNVVEVMTVRWGAHFFGQNDKYRNDKEKVEDAMKNRDCVKLYQNYLLEKGLIDQKYIADLEEQLNKELDEVIERAAKCEYATKEEVYTKEMVYATPETGGDL